MKFALLIMLSIPSFAMETIICSQSTDGLECNKYNGGDYLVFNYPLDYENKNNEINFYEAEGFQVMSIEDNDEDDDKVGEVESSLSDTIGVIESYASWAAGFNFAQEKKE
jgi:hypothetical protein